METKTKTKICQHEGPCDCTILAFRAAQRRVKEIAKQVEYVTGDFFHGAEGADLQALEALFQAIDKQLRAYARKVSR